VSEGYLLVLYYVGPQAHFFTDTSGGGDPSPKLAFKIQPVSGRVAPPPTFSGLWGQWLLRQLVFFSQTSVGATSSGHPGHFLKSPAHSKGGRGVGHAPPHPPYPPLTSEAGVGGGATHHIGSPLFFIMCGAGPRTPPAPLGGRQSIVCSAWF